jgi:hypothetical protein
MEIEKNLELRQQTGELISHKIFDELASIKMIRQDVDMRGDVTQETWNQIYNEELSFVAEAIDKPMVTRFKLQMSSSGLIDERGVLLREALQRGRIAAQQTANKDNRLNFNVKRAKYEYHEGLLAEQMMTHGNANTMFFVSPFSEEAHQKYGDNLLESIGMQPKRKLAFIRVYQKINETEMQLATVSIDNSDARLFAELLSDFGVDIPDNISSDDLLGYSYQGNLDLIGQELLPEKLRNLYDKKLSKKYGGEFKAGRQKNVTDIDAWDFIINQQDLLEHYFSKLKDLAIEKPDDLYAKRKLTYSFWATLKTRLDRSNNNKNRIVNCQNAVMSDYQRLEFEMRSSLKIAVNNHEQMIGCGGTIGISADLLDENPDVAINSIFAEASDKYGSLKFKCKFGHINSRPYGELITKCRVKSCKNSVACVP